MRALAPGLLILLAVAAAGPAAAQTTPTWGLQVAVADFEAPLRPLADEVGTPVTVEASCAALAAGGGTATVNLDVVDKPPWMDAAFSPATITLDSASCDSATGTATGAATLLARASADAPAFTPTAFTVEATLEGPSGERATTAGNVTVDYFSVLDVTTSTPVINAKPQRQVDIPINVTNFGNAATTVVLTTDAPDDLNVILSPPITVDSKQQGAPSNERTLLVSIYTPYHNGYVNARGVITFDILSHYALDRALEGDTTRVSVNVVTQGVYVPTVGAAVAGLALALTALAFSRRPGY